MLIVKEISVSVHIAVVIGYDKSFHPSTHTKCDLHTKLRREVMCVNIEKLRRGSHTMSGPYCCHVWTERVLNKNNCINVI